MFAGATRTKILLLLEREERKAESRFGQISFTAAFLTEFEIGGTTRKMKDAV
jgi:hypothetical protein